MVTINIASQKQLFQLLSKYAGNRATKDLLVFWCRHPNAKFARSAIYCDSGPSRLDVDKGLEEMVEAGLVDTNVHNSVRLYWLTVNEEKRQPITELATLGWAQWQRMVRRLAEAG